MINYRAEISTHEQLTESVEINDFAYIYAPMELFAVNVGANSVRPKPEEISRIIIIPPVFLGGNEPCSKLHSELSGEPRIAEKLRELKGMGFKGALAHTLGHIELIQNAGLQVHGGFRLNITNSLSQKQYEDLGLTDGIFSVELSFKRISAIEKNIPMGIMAYGHLPLMILRRCPVMDNKPCGKSGCEQLTDRLGNRVKTICRYSETEILNTVPLNLSDKAINADFAVLKFAPDENIAKIFNEYKSKSEPYGKFTRGLYYKKVK